MKNAFKKTQLKLYDIVPGIKVADVSDVVDFDNRMVLSNEQFPQYDRCFIHDTLPEQTVRNKLARNMGWTICKSEYDAKSKEFWFECIINANSTEVRRLNHKQVCESFHWKSFEFIDNGMRIKFKQDEKWFEPIPAAPAPAKKRGRKAKAK